MGHICTRDLLRVPGTHAVPYKARIVLTLEFVVGNDTELLLSCLIRLCAGLWWGCWSSHVWCFT